MFSTFIFSVIGVCILIILLVQLAWRSLAEPSIFRYYHRHLLLRTFFGIPHVHSFTADFWLCVARKFWRLSSIFNVILKEENLLDFSKLVKPNGGELYCPDERGIFDFFRPKYLIPLNTESIVFRYQNLRNFFRQNINYAPSLKFAYLLSEDKTLDTLFDTCAYKLSSTCGVSFEFFRDNFSSLTPTRMPASRLFCAAFDAATSHCVFLHCPWSSFRFVPGVIVVRYSKFNTSILQNMNDISNSILLQLTNWRVKNLKGGNPMLELNIEVGFKQQRLYEFIMNGKIDDVFEVLLSGLNLECEETSLILMWLAYLNFYSRFSGAQDHVNFKPNFSGDYSSFEKSVTTLNKIQDYKNDLQYAATFYPEYWSRFANDELSNSGAPIADYNIWKEHFLLLGGDVESNPGPSGFNYVYRLQSAMKEKRRRLQSTISDAKHDLDATVRSSLTNCSELVQAKQRIVDWYYKYDELLALFPQHARFEMDVEVVRPPDIPEATITTPPSAGGAENAEDVAQDTVLSATTEGEHSENVETVATEGVMDGDISNSPHEPVKQTDRWIKIDEGTITTATGTGFVKAINLPLDAVVSNPTDPNFLGMGLYDFCRAGMHIEVRTRTTKFVRLCLRVAWFPHFAERDDQQNLLNQATVSQMLHCDLVGTTANKASFYIRHDSYLNMLPIPESKQVNSLYYGTLIYWLVNPLTAAQGVVPSVPYQTYVRFDTKYYVQRNRVKDPCLFEGGLTTMVINGAVNMATKKLVSSAEGMVSGFLGNFMAGLNNDRPVEAKGPQAMFEKPVPSMCIGDGVYHGDVLRLNASASKPHFKSAREFSYKHIASCKGQIATFNIPANTAAGTQVFGILTGLAIENPVNTPALVANGVENWAPVDHVADDFKAVTGDIHYEFQFITNGFDIVAVRIVYNPNQASTQPSQITALPNKVFELGPDLEKKVYTAVTVPYTLNMPLTTLGDSASNPVNTGHLSVWMESAYVGDAATGIQVNVYKMASENLEFQIPTACNTRPIIIAPDGGEYLPIQPDIPQKGPLEPLITRNVTMAFLPPDSWLAQAQDIQTTPTNNCRLVVAAGQEIRLDGGLLIANTLTNGDVWTTFAGGASRVVPRANFVNQITGQNHWVYYGSTNVATLSPMLVAANFENGFSKNPDARYLLHSEPHNFYEPKQVNAACVTGETFSLRSRLRRFEQFIMRQIIVDTQVVAQKILDFPANFGFSSFRHQSTMPNSKALIIKYGDCFRFVSGSVRFRLIIHGLTPGEILANFKIQHDALTIPLYDVTEQVLQSPNIETSNATCMITPLRNNIIDIEVPYYSQFHQLLNSSYLDNPPLTTMATSLGKLALLYSGPPREFTVEILRAMGDDAVFRTFTGFPQRVMVSDTQTPLQMIQPDRPPATSLNLRRKIIRKFTDANTIQKMLVIGGVELNPGPLFSYPLFPGMREDLNEFRTEINDKLGKLSADIGIAAQSHTQMSDSVTDFIKGLGEGRGLSQSVIVVVTALLQAAVNQNTSSMAISLVQILTELRLIGVAQFSKLFNQLSNYFTRLLPGVFEAGGSATTWLTDTLSAVISAICAFCGVKKLPTSGLWSKLFIGVRDTSSMHKRFSAFLMDFFHLLKRLCFYIKYRKQPEAVLEGIITRESKKISEWYCDVNKITDPMVYASIVADTRYQSKVYSLYEQGLKYSQATSLSAHKISSNHLRRISRDVIESMRKLHDLKSKITFITSQPTVKYEPFVFYLSGKAGTGKSTIADRALHECLEEMGIVYNGNPIYTFSWNTEYDNGLAEHPAYKMDEYLDSQVTDTSRKQVELLKALKSHSLNNANMAHLDDKNLQMRPRVVAILSNQQSAAHADYQPYEACDRRRDVCYNVTMRTDLLACEDHRVFTISCVGCKHLNTLNFKTGLSVFQEYSAMAVNNQYPTIGAPMSQEEFIKHLRKKCGQYNKLESENYAAALQRSMNLSNPYVASNVDRSVAADELIEELSKDEEEATLEDVEDDDVNEAAFGLFENGGTTTNVTFENGVTTAKKGAFWSLYILFLTLVYYAKNPPAQLVYWIAGKVKNNIPNIKFPVKQGADNEYTWEVDFHDGRCFHSKVNRNTVLDKGMWCFPSDKRPGYILKIPTLKCTGAVEIWKEDLGADDNFILENYTAYGVRGERPLVKEGDEVHVETVFLKQPMCFVDTHELEYKKRCIAWAESNLEGVNKSDQYPPYFEYSQTYKNMMFHKRCMVWINLKKHSHDPKDRQHYELAIGIIVAIIWLIGCYTALGAVWGLMDKVNPYKPKDDIRMKMEGGGVLYPDDEVAGQGKKKGKQKTKKVKYTRTKFEGAKDIDLYSGVINKIQSNYCFYDIPAREGSTNLIFHIKLLAIGGQAFLTNAHSWRRTLNSGVKHFTLMNQGVARVITVANVCAEHLNPTDICILTIKDMRYMPTITQHFIAEEKNRTSDVQIIDFHPDGKTMVKDVIAQDIIQPIRLAEDYFQAEMTGYSYNYHGVGVCMSLLFDKNINKVISIHIAGKDGTGFGQAVYKEMLDEFINIEVQPPDVIEEITESKFECGTPYGSVTRVYVNTKTEFEKSKLPMPFTPIKYPAVLAQKGDEFPGQQAFNNTLKKRLNIVKPINNEIVELAAKYLKTLHRVTNQPTKLPVVGKITLQDAIFGDDTKYGKPMRLDTSAGYPYSCEPGAKGKYHLIDFEEILGKRKLVKVRDDLMVHMEDIVENAKRGVIKSQCFIATLKDERLKQNKILNPRIIDGTPVQLAIPTVQYTKEFTTAFYTGRIQNHSAVGIDIHSFEWQQLAQRLNKHPNVIDADFKCLGPTLANNLIFATVDIINDWYLQFGDKNQFVRQNLLLQNVDCFEVILDEVVRNINGSPSGAVNTTTINTECVILMVLCAWKELTGLSFYEFRKNVELIVYGDDVIMSFSDDVKVMFNGVTIKRYFDEHNIGFTTGDKSDENLAYTTLDKVKFLQRRFRLDTKVNRYLPAIDKESIEDILCWQRKKCTMEEHVQTANSALINAFYLGKEYYDNLSSTIQKAFRNVNEIFIPSSYEEVLYEFINNEN